jgi:hydroxymethylglutaryl-CoA synthase
MQLGSLPMRELGNLYSASLPAWMAAGMEEARLRDVDLAGQEVLALGYGSGDAAEAIPMRAVANWWIAAERISFADSLKPSADLSREEYTQLHRTGTGPHRVMVHDEFIIDRIGTSTAPEYADEGVEYYRFVR